MTFLFLTPWNDHVKQKISAYLNWLSSDYIKLYASVDSEASFIC